MASLWCVEFKEAVGLEMKGFRVVGREQEESLVQGIGMPSEGEREMRKVVDVYLGLVRACERLASRSSASIFGLRTGAHDPVPIFTDSYARARFFKLKVLQ